MILSRQSIQRRRTDSGFTLIELLVVIAIMSILICMLTKHLQDARKQGELVSKQAEDPRLQRIGQSVGDCVETTESSVGPIHEAFTIAQATDTAIPADELELYRDELRVQRQWLGEDLAALQRIYPELSNRDKELARDLRRPLRQLDLELEQAARSIEVLLVEPSSER